MKVSERFMQHNREVPIVYGAWLDKDKKEPKGPPGTWKYFRCRLDDGTVYDIPDAEMKEMRAAGYLPQWSGLKP